MFVGRIVWGSDCHGSEYRHDSRVPGADGLDLRDAYKTMAWPGEADDDGRAVGDPQTGECFATNRARRETDALFDNPLLQGPTAEISAPHVALCYRASPTTEDARPTASSMQSAVAT